jgi:excinuclease ABC subunit C
MARQPAAPPSALRQRVARLPDRPGVYLFKDAQGAVLYVGKALSLRKRVASYFRPDGLPPRIAQMMKRVADLETRPTASETEALLLEAQLIKDRTPRYNVAFRDDKAYPMLKVTAEPFPRLLVARRRVADGAAYFGPFTEAGLMHEALRFLRRVFPMRTCAVFPKSPCLEYHLGQCLAPCVGFIGPQSYRRIVEDLVAFLSGKRDRLLRDLERRMQQAARDRRFEEAGRLRDQIQALTSVIAAKAHGGASGPLEQLQAALKLPRPPARIEAFDISNIFGDWAVGSMVVFEQGRPRTAHYRRFRIETVQGIDDCAMMREVIRRRYGGSLAARLPPVDPAQGGVPSQVEGLPLPDLILVDGGKGQLSAACAELAALKLALPAIGLAKRFEHIVLPDVEEPVVLLPTSPVLHLVQHVRDEAHRFAIAYHRRLRGATATVSALDGIPGVGPARKAALLRQFGSVASIAAASPEAIARAARVPAELAVRLLRRLHSSSRS